MQTAVPSLGGPYLISWRRCRHAGANEATTPCALHCPPRCQAPKPSRPGLPGLGSVVASGLPLSDWGRGARERVRAPPRLVPHPIPAASLFALAAPQQKSGESPAAAALRCRVCNPTPARVGTSACTYPTPAVRRSAPKLENCLLIIARARGPSRRDPAGRRAIVFAAATLHATAACPPRGPCQRPAPRSSERSTVAERSPRRSEALLRRRPCTRLIVPWCLYKKGGAPL